MAKDIIFSNEARLAMAKGIKTLYDTVKVTLGPKGRNVMIEQAYGAPIIVNDGVTIAKEIELKNQFENLAAASLIEAATKTNDLVGDGTTSAIIVASVLILQGIEKVNQGENPVMIRKGLNYYLPIILDKITTSSHFIQTKEDIKQIAYISSNDEELADLIATAYETLGTNGVITVSESKTTDTTLNIVKGYSYDRGYLSPYMVSQNQTNIVIENPLILITDRKIISMNELIPFIEEAMKKNAPLFIICDDIEQEVLSALVINKLRGLVNVVVTKAPAYAEKKQNILNDLAILTNATFSPIQLKSSLSKENNSLGTISKVIIKKDETILIGGNETNAIKERITTLKNELLNTLSEYEKNNLEERIAKLSSGIGIINIGALTELELKEKKLRAEDAICATKAALQNGVIAGGGKIFFELSELIKQNSEYPCSRDILVKALQQPFLQILENCGCDKKEILKQINHEYWYDANLDTVVKYSESGIIDPTQVLIAVISNAISIASVFLTTECAIISDKQNNKEISEDNLL